MTDTPAAETLVLDIHEISPVADHFVICSGQNERQLRAISREVTERLSTAGTRPTRTEGNAPGGWIVLDYGAVIVHIFDEDQRAFYRLEEPLVGSADAPRDPVEGEHAWRRGSNTAIVMTKARSVTEDGSHEGR